MDNIHKIEFEYLTELKELIQTAEDSLLKIETQNNVEHELKILKRAFHSLKGNCGMLDLVKLEQLFHELENYLNTNQAQIISELDLYLKVVDNLKLYFKNPTDSLLELPFKKMTQTRSMTRDNSNLNADGKNLVISILDDNQEILNLFSDYLNSKNIAARGYLAMSELRNDLMKNIIPDLIIIDFNLKEGINGNTVIKVLNNMLPKIPKVIMSAEYESETLYSAINRGIIGALKKPFSKTDLDDILVKTKNIKNQNLKNEAINNLVKNYLNLSEAQLKKQINEIEKIN
jgi:FixJ family two-component response regulator/HPt (histidine-containing phosphotransfer) domain-containing protein